MNYEASIASAAATGQFGFAEAGVTIPSLEAWASQQDLPAPAPVAEALPADLQRLAGFIAEAKVAAAEIRQ